MLFHGNPYLIQGFNTFLPPGYRIEMSADPRDPNVITVTTPMGTTTQSTNTFGHHARPGRDGLPQIGTPGGLQFGNNGPLPPLGGSRSGTPLAYQLPHLQPAFESVVPPFSPGLQVASTTAAASFLGNLNNKNVEKQQAGEFNHAIQYLNKIKARYSDDPDKYKNFLEILQTYQKEQRGLNDVSMLPISATSGVNVARRSPKSICTSKASSKTHQTCSASSRTFCLKLQGPVPPVVWLEYYHSH
jgi:paired amphipathic helix protein Sin3a